jgi:chemotaxis family two-component system sensor kinase Cph1
VLWTRAEEVETVRWAGEPVKATTPDGVLTPRASFEAWTQTVRGRSRPWTPAQTNAALRLRENLIDLRRARRTAELNASLRATLQDKDELLRQKDFLLREVNHRVQNSLALAASFLTIQMKSIQDPVARGPLEEASRRLTAVGLVHRRLYHGDQLETVALDRYLAELAEEMVGTLDEAWARNLRVDAAPVTVPTDKAVIIGLVVTELLHQRGQVRLSRSARPAGHRPGRGRRPPAADRRRPGRRQAGPARRLRQQDDGRPGAPDGRGADLSRQRPRGAGRTVRGSF